MRAADVLRELGRPIAYYPYLSRYVGGVNAAVLFCQLFYWQDKAQHELGVHKTVDELELETGLSYEEQRAARTKLRACGVLIETAKRIEHKTYFRIDEDALERLLESPPPTKAPRKIPSGGMGKTYLPKWEKSISGNGESPPREVDKPDSASEVKPMPRDGETPARGKGDSHSVNGTETTAEITSETTAAAACASGAVDNSAAAAADEQNLIPTNRERELTELLIALERGRGKALAIDQNDRVLLIAWRTDELTDAELREAHKRAVGARGRDRDDRPTYAAFVDRFVREVLAARPIEAGGACEWWLGGETDVCNEGFRLGVRPKKPEEPLPHYRVLVAKAAGRGPWIDHVLQHAQRSGSEQFLRWVVETIGEKLMPVDWYAS